MREVNRGPSEVIRGPSEVIRSPSEVIRGPSGCPNPSEIAISEITISEITISEIAIAESLRVRGSVRTISSAAAAALSACSSSSSAASAAPGAISTIRGAFELASCDTPSSTSALTSATSTGEPSSRSTTVGRRAAHLWGRDGAVVSTCMLGRGSVVGRRAAHLCGEATAPW